VEARYRAAGDRDEREGEHLSGEYRPTAIGELRQGRHLKRRQDDQDAERQGDDDADLDECGQVVARREE
jgi:hypothetical protein